jgi:hypothetical protein
LELNINVEGIESIQSLLSGVPGMFDLAVQDVAKTLRNLVIGRTPVLTGALKKSWSTVSRTSVGFTFGTDLDYAQILEEGLYRGVGPRTVASGSGVFSRQAPSGIIGPLLEDERMIDRVATEIVRELERQMNQRAS